MTVDQDIQFMGRGELKGEVLRLRNLLRDLGLRYQPEYIPKFDDRVWAVVAVGAGGVRTIERGSVLRIDGPSVEVIHGAYCTRTWVPVEALTEAL